MKIIPKLQNGKGLESLFTTYVPVQAPQQTRSAKASQSERSSGQEDKEKLTEKDFFNMLKGIDGLPNEMQTIVNDLIDTLNINKISGMELSDLSTTYLQSLYKVRQAVNNKKQYDEVQKRAIESGSMSEPAITMDGKIVVQDQEGQIQKVSLREFMKNRDQYGGVLTVSNLLNMRAYSQGFVNDFSIFDIANNSVGYQSFQKLVKDAINTLGSTQISRQGISSSESQASKGLSLLRTLSEQDQEQLTGTITSDGLYRYKIINKNQKSQIDALTNYISALIPENAKIWAALKLNTSDKEKAAASLITTYLSSGESITNEVLMEPTTISKKTSGESKSGSGSSNEPNMTFLAALQNGYGGNYERRKYNPGGNGAFYVTGSSYGAFLNQSGDVITNVNLQELLAQTGLAGITNVNSITFGDNLIKSNQIPLIAVQNTGGVRTILPCKRNGSQVIPDFELMGAYDALVQEVNDELGSTASFEQREEALQRKIQQNPKLKELLDVSGKLDYNKFCAFVVVDGLASDLNFTFKSKDGHNISESPNPLIQETDDEADQKYFDAVTQEKLNDSLFKNVFGTGLNKDKLYKSTIFIPINTNNRLSGVLFSGQKLKDSTALELEQEYQTSLGAQSLNSSNPLLLWQ